MAKSRIFSIEEFSVYDGPGIRTTIFFKGCPLDCNWCHSPEGKSFKNISLRSPNGCLHCNRCVDICPTKRENCIGCGKCVGVCPRNLIRMAAEDIDNKDLYATLEKNFNILNLNNGGITLSGGEPTLQHEALEELIDMCKGKVHIALQTCGYVQSDIFKRIIDKVDLVLFDMKIMDKELAKEFEGVDNTLILNNLEILKASNTPFIARVPLIPGVIDTEKNIEAIIDKLKDAKNLLLVEELPYNKYAGSKYTMANMVYKPKFDESIPSNPRLEIYEKHNMKVRVL